ncbi:MAG: sulfite exporter TauE/SafE family protein, partial [Rickettsiales bacterium]
MDFGLETLIILFFASIIAETYGAIFGGGSFLLQPIMLALGIPPHLVIANDVGASTGTALSGAYVFRKHKYVVWELAKWWIPGIIIGPVLGAQLLAVTPAWMVEKLIAVFCIAGSIYVLFFKQEMRATETVNLPESWKIKAVFASLVLGTYFGFSGAGAGILSSLMLYGIFGLSLKYTLGTRKF